MSHPDLMVKNAFSGNKKCIFSSYFSCKCTHGRMSVRGRYAPDIYLFRGESEVVWYNLTIVKPAGHVSDDIFIIQFVIFIKIFFKSFLV